MRNLASQIPLRRELIPLWPSSTLNRISVRATLASSRVITMLPSSPQVKSVYSQIMSVLQKLDAGLTSETLFIDSTTLDVDIARGIASDVVNAGAHMVDAPVSGGTQFVRRLLNTNCNIFCSGVSGAKAGTLSFLVGGTEEVFQVSQPILSLMGERIIYCGPSGSGLAAKICNNVSYRSVLKITVK